MKLRIVLLLVLAGANLTTAQVTITIDDMSTDPGLYSFYYRSSDDYPTNNLQGSPGGPQVWDFTNGPTDHEDLIEIVDAADTDHGGDFPGAVWAQQQTDQGDGDQNWIYRNDNSQGIYNYGIYSEDISETEPALTFQPPVLDLPLPLNYGDSWNYSTTTYTELEYDGDTYDTRIELYSTNTADAWGTIIVPQGSAECLRINTVNEYTISIDTFFGWVEVATYYTRSYQWATENRDFAAMLTSKEDDSAVPPPDFDTASMFSRLLETNHPGANPPAPVVDLQIARSDSGILLNWTAAEYATSYRVEASSDPWFSEDISVLGETEELFFLDEDPGNRRFYRVIAVN
jgi:hypothetical protein